MKNLQALIVLALCTASCDNPAEMGTKKFFDAALAKNQEAELDAAVQMIAPTIQCQPFVRDIEALRANPDHKSVAEALTRMKQAARTQGCML